MMEACFKIVGGNAFKATNMEQFPVNPWSERCLLHLKLLYYLIQGLSFFHSSKYQKKKKLQ